MDSRQRKLLQMIALTIIAIVVAISIPMYRTMILRSREKTLQVNLHSLRDVIGQYAEDKKKAPQTLQDLVDGGYFRELPRDPMTDSNTTWETESTATGIKAIHSGSDLVSSEGTPYSTW